MSEADTVSQGQCDDRMKEAFQRLGGVDKAVAKIFGGIAVASFVFVLFVGGAFYHINYRFSNIEKTLGEISDKIEKI